VVFHATIVFVPGELLNDGVLVVCFFGVMFAASYPVMCRDAPYSFWILACVYWVLGGVLMALLKLGAKMALSSV
jgi:hypothetical protein